LQTPNKHH
jgi:hypothetical protein